MTKSRQEKTPEGPVETRTIHVYLLRHREGDLLAAISTELHGLVVHGRSPEEIERKLAGAVRDLLEAEGHTVISVAVERDDRVTGAGFGPPPFIANAALAAR